MSGNTSRRQRQAVSETLHAIGHTVTAPLELNEGLRRTTRELTRALGADVGSVWRIDAERKRPVAVAGTGLWSESAWRVLHLERGMLRENGHRVPP